MKIAVIGGGITGLTVAYELSQDKKNEITIFEKEKQLGGLASGFKKDNWGWYLDKTYHHILLSDNNFLSFAKKIGFKKVFFKTPLTSSLYFYKKQFVSYPLDTVKDFISFPLLDLWTKIRAGITIIWLKFSPFFSLYERMTSESFLKKWMGSRGWDVLFKPLFRGKFGKYAGNILSVFIWARIKKRSKKLGYVEGGFQAFVNFLEKKLTMKDVLIFKNKKVNRIGKKGDMFIVNKQEFNKVVFTSSTSTLINVEENIFPKEYLSKLVKIKYLHSLSLIIETKNLVLPETYWLSIAIEKIPFTVLVQQTNFIDKKYYGGKNFLYVGWYLDDGNKLLDYSRKELLSFVSPYLKKINPQFSEEKVNNIYSFRSFFSQPLFNQEFIKFKPRFITPVKGFYLANLDMTYPYDRGVNYAIKAGQKVASLCSSLTANNP